MKDRFKPLLALTILGIATTPSIAADPITPSVNTGIVEASPSKDWSGFYAGLNAGYGWGEIYDDNGAIVIPAPPAPVVTTVNRIDGFSAGVQAGYNFQQDAFVFGIEADIQHMAGSQFVGGWGPSTLDYLGTVRGRIGVDLDGVMPYLTAGFAYGQGSIGNAALVQEKHFHTGLAAGAGVEMMVNDQFSVKGEYLYYDLTQVAYPVKAAPAVNGVGFRGSVARVGLNFRFD
mgnify:CR=1 FL=1